MVILIRFVCADSSCHQLFISCDKNIFLCMVPGYPSLEISALLLGQKGEGQRALLVLVVFQLPPAQNQYARASYLGVHVLFPSVCKHKMGTMMGCGGSILLKRMIREGFS